MAKMIDKKPLYKGESIVWDSLSNYLPSDIVYFAEEEALNSYLDLEI